MNTPSNWTVPKLPFLVGDGVLLAFAAWLAWQAQHPLGAAQVAICSALVALGALLGAVPFMLEYRAISKLVEVNGLTTVADKIQQLDQVAGQIAACTNDWTNAQTQAERTAAGAKETAEHMSAEARKFAEFMQRMNDSEKSSLRLEIEKLRRAEVDWLQVLARVLDNVFVLRTAAEHSGQPRVAGEIAQFQHDCHEAARRVGMAPFFAEPEEAFNAERHQAMGVKEAPPAGSIVAETIRPGYTYQGKMVRPVLVRLRENAPSLSETPKEAMPESDRPLTLEPKEQSN